jgi:excisionase family DNA binding protein
VSAANRAATPQAPLTAETKTKGSNSGEAEIFDSQITAQVDGIEGRKTMIASGERLMSLADLSEMLGIPVNTLYGWRTRGEGPAGYRVGRHIRYRRSTVEAWLETQTDARRTMR